MRQKEHSEPEELTETAQVLEVSFSGQEYRGRQALCAGYRGAAPCWGQGVRVAGGDLCGKAAKAPTDAERRPSPIGGLRAASPIGSRVKRLAQGELMPASTRTGYYLTQTFAGFAASPPFPVPGTSSQEGGNLFETDTTQRALRQAWHL